MLLLSGQMKIISVYLFCFYLKTVLNQCDYNDENEIIKVMDQYKLHPVYQHIKEKFYKKYGNKEFNVLERIIILKDQLQNFSELTNRKNIPDNLKIIFKTTINSLRPDFIKLNHNKIILKNFFNLTDEDAATYRQLYSEATDVFTQLDKRFKIESDC